MSLSLFKGSQSPSQDLLYFCFTCMDVLLACISVYCMWGRAFGSQKRAGVTDGRELPYKCWELSQGGSSGKPARALNRWLKSLSTVPISLVCCKLVRRL